MMQKRRAVELAHERQRRQMSRSLYEFIKGAWSVIEPSQPFVDGWHIGAIAEHLEAVRTGQIKNLLINIPPRHAKSTIVSVAYPAWLWNLNPGHKFIFASHSAKLSKRDSIRCRGLIQSHWYQGMFDPDWKMSTDQNEAMRFENTKKGYRIATSTGASVMGEGADTLVLDDPHPPSHMRSDTKLRNTVDWMDQEFFIRVNDPEKSSKIIIMQRLGERDASQHVLDKGGWTHLMLPAEFEESRRCVTSIGWVDDREEGEALWPERFTNEDIADLAKVMGPMSAAGQLQQRPAPAEGNVVKRDWWRYYREAPKTFDKVVQSWDLTFDKTEKGSFVVGQVWGKVGANKYLLHQYRERVGFTDQVNALIAMTKDYPDATTKLVEKKANGAALIDTLKGKVSGIVPVEPSGSKENRAEAVSAHIRSGNVYLPHPDIADWVEGFVEEWAVIPNGRYWDQVDAASQALHELEDAMDYDCAPISITAPSKWLR